MVQRWIYIPMGQWINMVEAQDRDRQNGTSVMAFADKHGYMPPTVTGHERHRNGMTLETLTNDPEKNIEIYDDDRDSHLTGNPPEEEE
jgi:hypothetical protein